MTSLDDVCPLRACRYVRISGDYFGLVGGRVLGVHEILDENDKLIDTVVEPLEVSPAWETCEHQDRTMDSLTAFVTGK